MARPVTLFTGQWADLSFDEVCKKAKSFGYDGVELACWGDHFEVDKANKDKNDGKKGFDDFGKRFGPILEAFEKENVNFALEVHPTEIAFDTASAQRAIEAVKGHKRFGFNYDPSHLGYQGVDYVKFIRTFKDRIYHAHMKDVWWGHGDGTVGVFGGHVHFGEARR